MRNDTERERKLFFSKSPRALGVMFIMRELWWDLIVPFFVCVCVCMSPSAANPFRVQPILSGFWSALGCPSSDPAVELTLLKQCIDFGRAGEHGGKAENGAELCKTGCII